jgi:hypothetical protein
MHLAPSHTIRRKDIEAPFCADPLAEIELSLGVFPTDGGNGTERHVGPIGHPIYPIEFAEIGGSGVDVDTRTEVRVWRGVFRQEELIVSFRRKI